jgi:hypothetical protein
MVVILLPSLYPLAALVRQGFVVEAVVAVQHRSTAQIAVQVAQVETVFVL